MQALISYLNGDLESFFTPWHAVLYSGYAFSVLSTMYIKNSIKDYRIDMVFLGAVIFGIGGGLDLLWHTFLGIEQGVEPLSVSFTPNAFSRCFFDVGLRICFTTK